MEKKQVARWDDVAATQPLPLISFQRLDSDRMTLVRYVYEPGAVFPPHSHAEEQATMVLSGEIEFTLEGETVLARAGSVLFIPPSAVHGARVLGPVAVETLNALVPRRTQAIAYAARAANDGEAGG